MKTYILHVFALLVNNKIHNVNLTDSVFKQ
jgi:hypothetical protein